MRVCNAVFYIPYALYVNYNTVKLSACTELATTKTIKQLFVLFYVQFVHICLSLKAMLPHAYILYAHRLYTTNCDEHMKHEVRRQPPEDYIGTQYN